MRLAWVELTDFRSYSNLRFEPDAGINILVGANGAGKTNLLEGVGYLSLLRSFRGAPDAALIRDGADEAVARGGFLHAAGETRVEVALPAERRRRVLVNGKRPARFSDVPLTVPLVAFLPDDLDVVKRGPALRRQYLDELAAQLTPAAGADQAEFTKALRQRNGLLRQDGPATDPLTLDVWDERLADAGARLVTHRLRLIDRLGPEVEASYRSVGGEGATLRWEYVGGWAADFGPSVEADLAGQLREALASRRRRDVDARTTTTGPHRDDPQLFLSRRDVRTRASQGEQRSVALALRVAAYRLLEQRHGHPPMLLLDDVFSELDLGRAAGVMALLPRGQVFVTTAREDEVAVPGRVWRVSDGAVAGTRARTESTPREVSDGA